MNVALFINESINNGSIFIETFKTQVIFAKAGSSVILAILIYLLVSMYWHGFKEGKFNSIFM